MDERTNGVSDHHAWLPQLAARVDLMDTLVSNEVQTLLHAMVLTPSVAVAIDILAGLETIFYYASPAATKYMN